MCILKWNWIIQTVHHQSDWTLDGLYPAISLVESMLEYKVQQARGLLMMFFCASGTKLEGHKNPRVKIHP